MCEEAFRRTKAAPRPVCGEHFAGVPLRRVVLTGAPIQGGLGREWKNHSFGWSWGCCCSLKGFFTALFFERLFHSLRLRNCVFAVPKKKAPQPPETVILHFSARPSVQKRSCCRAPLPTRLLLLVLRSKTAFSQPSPLAAPNLTRCLHGRRRLLPPQSRLLRRRLPR